MKRLRAETEEEGKSKTLVRILVATELGVCKGNFLQAAVRRRI